MPERLVEQAGEQLVEVVGVQVGAVAVQADRGGPGPAVEGHLGVAVAVGGVELAGTGGLGGAWTRSLMPPASSPTRRRQTIK